MHTLPHGPPLDAHGYIAERAVGGGGGGDWSYPPVAVQARKMGTSSALETSFFFFLRLDLLLERGEGWGKRGRET